MSKILEWFDGKKSYIIAIAVATVGILVASGIAIPDWVYTILAAFGIVAAKSAIKKAE